MKIRKIGKKSLSAILLAIILLVQVPVNAADVNLDVSSWAKSEVKDGERYGLFTKTW